MKFEYCEKKINELSKQSFLNSEQKNIFLKILKNVENDHDRADVFNQLFQRVKVGLTFDEAPLYESNNIYTLNYIKSKSIICSKKTTRQDQLENSLIIGENYEVLNNLLITHKEKIDIIYIDPPYNTNQFTSENKSYKDKFTKSAWLTMMKERLILAKELLKSDGIIFISIDDNMQAYLKVLMDEIFGEKNFIKNLIWRSNPGGRSDDKYIATSTEYILFYAKNNEYFSISKRNINRNEELIHKNKYGKYKIGPALYKSGSNKYLSDRPNMGYTIYWNENEQDGKIRFEYDKKTLKYFEFDENLLNQGYKAYRPKKYTVNGALKMGCWRWGVFDESEISKKIDFTSGKPKEKDYRHYSYQLYSDLIEEWTSSNGTNKLKKIIGADKFPNPKPSFLINHLINFHTNKNSLILDFFAGSGTTGHAVMELNRKDDGNRKFILCTNSENNIDKICYERLYRIIKGYGTNNEKDFKWLDNNKPYLVNMNYYNLKHHNIDIHKNEDTLEKIDIKPYKILSPKLDLDSNNKSEKLYELIKHINKIDE